MKNAAFAGAARYRACVFVALALGVSHTVSADKVLALPDPLVAAAAAYKAKGADLFLPTLVKGSRLQGANSASFSRANAMLKAVETHYGDFKGVEMVGAVPVSASTRVVYFVINYARGPLYGVADLYRTADGEVVTNSNVNTELTQIIPAEILSRLR